MATIRKRTNGKSVSWQAQVRRRGFPAVSETFRTEREAKDWARGIEADMSRRTYVSLGEAEQTTLGEALKRYRDEVTATKKGAKQETNRINALREMVLAEYSLANLRSTDIATWRNELVEAGKAPTTIRNMVTIISQVYERARIEWGMEGLRNPARGVPMPGLRKGRDRRLVGDEEKRLLEACENSRSHWIAPMVRLALATGMRRGELLSLRWENVDLKHGVARVVDTKNGEHRDVPLSTVALSALKRVPRSTTGDVFPLTGDSFDGYFRKAVKAAKIEGLRFHDLRHEATSRFFERGLDVMDVAHITGHKTLQMLRRYTHLRARDLARKDTSKNLATPDVI